MPLVLGLGNPGDRYSRTRHNVGWWTLDVLATRWSARVLEQAETYEARRATADGASVDLVKPLTFMNRSGDALRAWSERHAFDRAGLLVVSDDVYLPLGYIRLRRGGSAGGHRGLESIAEVLGTEAFARLRIGVGEAEHSSELREHVLDEFSDEDADMAQKSVDEAADAVALWVREGIAAAMNRFNRRVRKEVSES